MSGNFLSFRLSRQTPADTIPYNTNISQWGTQQGIKQYGHLSFVSLSYYLLKNAVFFVNGVDFDRINDQDCIGIFVKDLIGNRIRIFFF